MSEVKGDNVRINNVVRIEIKTPAQINATLIQGQVQGIRYWKTDQIAIQIEGIADWIYLDASAEIEVL